MLLSASAALVPGSQQNFEGGGLGYTLTGGFDIGSATTDYWAVIANNGSKVNTTTITTGGVFANASPAGGSVLAGDDTNAAGTSPVLVTFDPVNVAGLTNLSVNVLLAASNPTQGGIPGFETTDFVEIQVSYDGGVFQQLAIYEQDPSFNGGTNTFLSQDTNADGLGDAGSGTGATAIEQGFKNFSHALIAATTVQIRILVAGEATGEYVAIDDFRICGDVAVTNPPVLANVEGAALNYTEGDAATLVTNTVTVSDSDSTNITGATVQISANNTPSEDVLSGTSGGGVTVGPYDSATGTLTLSGTASLAAYQAALRSVTYQNTNVLNPNIAPRTVSFQVTDDQSNTSGPATRNINVANTVQTFAIPHTESFDDGLGTGDRYEVIGGFDVGTNDFFRQLPASDAATRFASPITGVVGAGFFGGEDIDQNGQVGGGEVEISLNATGLGNLSVDVLLAAATNTFELTDGLWVEYQFDGGAWNELAAFRPSGFGADLALDTDGDDVGDGTALTTALTNFNFPILDSGNTLKVRMRALTSSTGEEVAFDELTVNGNPVGPPPVLSNINPGPLVYTEGDGAVVISATATITDADDTNIESATVQISNNYVNGQDVLNFTPSGGIMGSFVPSTGILSLSGTASLTAYETVLQSVTYENTNLTAPNQNTRTVTWRVNDGDSSSNAQTGTIEVLDVVPAQPLVGGQHCESFETDGLGTRYAANTFNLGPDDFFDRAAANFGGLTGINADGSFAFGGEDTDADGNPVHSVEILVDTSSATNLQLDLKLAAVLNQFETTDTILIERESDGGGFVTLTTFNGTGINTSLTNGSVTLGPDYTDLNFSLPDALETRIRVTMNTSASGEEVAVDHICVSGTEVDPPVADLADPVNGGSISATTINTQGYIDVTFTDIGFNGLDPATIDGDEMALSGPGVGTAVLNGTAALVGGTTYRYSFAGNFVPGPVTVDFQAGSFVDLGGNLNVAETEGFTVLSSPQLTLTIAAAAISEDGGTTTATVTRNTGTTGALTVNLSSDDTSEATVPPTVTIPSGSDFATFQITAVDDALLDGTQTVTITASGAGYASGSDTLDVTDSEQLTLTIAAASVSEADGPGATTATVTRSNTDDLSSALLVLLVSNDTTEATVPATVTIPMGQATSLPFDIDALDDAIVDGTQMVTITAIATGYADGSDTVDVVDDDEVRVLDVLVSGSSWNTSNPALLAPFSLINGPDPAKPLPWINANTIEAQFNQHVDVLIVSMSLTGVNVPIYSFLPDDPTDTIAAELDGFRYDPATFRATWRLDSSIGADKLLIDISGEAADANPVQAAGGGLLLNGGGGEGTDFELRFDNLPGDVNRNTNVSVTDLVNVAARVQPGTFNTLYGAFFDVNGDGAIGANDLSNTAALIPSFLPAGEPGDIDDTSLGDFVWEDVDGDGIQDPGEPGIPGVTVELQDAAMNPIATTTTDAAGSYLFSDLTPGDYFVRFVQPAGFSFTTPNAGGADSLDSDADPTTGKTGVISLPSGAVDLRHDAGMLLPPLLVAAGGEGPGGVAALTDAQLAGVVQAAVERYAQAGRSTAQIDLLRSATFQIDDLVGARLGGAFGSTVLIDSDAAGHGWFVDDTPKDDSEFDNGTGPEGMDLLTVVMHEMGHVLGQPHTRTGSDLMAETLPTGTRRLPEASARHRLLARQVRALDLTPLHLRLSDHFDENGSDHPGLGSLLRRIAHGRQIRLTG